MWDKQSKRLFGSGVLLAGFIMGNLVMYVLNLATGLRIHYNLFQLCSSIVRRFGLMGVVYALNAVVVSTLLLSVWVALRQYYFAKRAFRKLRSKRDAKLSARFNRRYGEGRQRFMIIRHAEPAAFTLGFLFPRIVLSTGLIKLLSKDELEAVVHHEIYHQRHGDPLKTFLLYFFSVVMWYIPILAWLHHHYKMTREVLADRYAIAKQGTPLTLSTALLKLVKRKRPAPMAFAHVSFAETSVNYRIRQLLEPHPAASLKLPLIRIVISAAAIAVLGAMLALVRT